MSKVLTTTALSKKYRGAYVVKDLSLEVEKGAVFGLLGPNGSGKTTTLSMLLDIIPKDTGSYQWFEEEPSHTNRKRIGSIIETPNFIAYLSAERNLKMVAEIKGTDAHDVAHVLETVRLTEYKDQPFNTFSLGMKQRLAIASALLAQPEVLLLDEPTNGLDPQGIVEIRNLLIEISKKGVTIIIASHILDEIEKICSHVAIIKRGQLLIQGKVSEILSNDCILELKANDMERLSKALKKYSLSSQITKEQDKYIVKFPSMIKNHELNEFLFGEGVVLSHLASRKKNLELQFLEITK